MENLHPATKLNLGGDYLDFSSKDLQPGDVIKSASGVELRFERTWPDGSTEFTTLDGKWVVSVNSNHTVHSIEELGQD